MAAVLMQKRPPERLIARFLFKYMSVLVGVFREVQHGKAVLWGEYVKLS